jgi:enterochelin esterase family protein
MTYELLKRARQEGTPLIDGASAMLVWHGRSAPKLIGDFNDWDASRAIALTEIAPGVWMHTLALPRDAYMEYAFVRGERRVPDPLNPRAAPNGIGEVNHFFYMPDAAPTPLARRERGVPRGAVTRYVAEDEWLVVGGRRAVYLYQPPVDEACPLLVVLDGPDYLRRAKLPALVDNLIAQKRIRPIALAMVAHGGKARMIEYGCSEVALGLMLMKVLPLAREHLNLIDIHTQPGAYGVLGASLGGLAALYFGLCTPQVFGKVLSQSGAFSAMGYDYVVFDLVRDGGVRRLKIWLDAGKFEGLLAANQRMRDLLTAKGYAVAYREYSGGHNFPSWRDDLWRGLENLFGVQK